MFKKSLMSDVFSRNMKDEDCPKCNRTAMQTVWWTGKKYCPICDSGETYDE